MNIIFHWLLLKPKKFNDIINAKRIVQIAILQKSILCTCT